MARHAAYMDNTWRDDGVADIALWRTKGDGFADFAIFKVDLWCLGVIHVLFEEDIPVDACEAFVRDKFSADQRRSVDPAYAKKLIEGAVRYAEGLGFLPHREFRKGKRVLSGIDATTCAETFSYGRNGRPCYIPHEGDDDAQVDRVIAILTARVGEDGFDFEDDDQSGPVDDVLALRKEISAILKQEPNGEPSFYKLSGMTMAALLSPQPMTPDELTEILLENLSSIDADSAAAEDFAELVTQYWEFSAGLIITAFEPDSEVTLMDIYEGDFDMAPDGKTAAMWMVAANFEWVSGFKHLIEQNKEAWEPVLNLPELAPHWDLLNLWTLDNPVEGRMEQIHEAKQETPPRTLARSVLQIARVLRSG